MKKRTLVKSVRSKENVAKPQCGTYGSPMGTVCLVNFGAASENDILL